MNRLNVSPSRSRVVLSVLALAGFLCAPGAVAQSSLRELFQRGKTEFGLAAYDASLKTFQELDDLSQRPGFEGERVRLAPVICFYRGANLAALGRKEDARLEFEKYLAVFPRADLDRNAFPRAVLEAFEKARESGQAGTTGRASARAGERDEGIRKTYAGFRPEAGSTPIAEERWADGPIRYLMTKSEKADWDSIRDSAARAEFVVKFWQVRDPNPLTPENEFRAEFERRISFADTYFAVAEKRGSEMDRGLVFALLGPPAYIARFSLMSQDDPVQAARALPLRQTGLAPSNSRFSSSTVYVDQPPLTAQEIQGTREVWHYTREQLPPPVPFNEIDVEFLTKEGYGTAVLQRDQRILLALEAAAQDRQSRN